MIEYGDVSIRYVANVDADLARDCCFIASQFVGNNPGLVHSLKYDVNVLRYPMFVAERANGRTVGFVMGKHWPKRHDAEITALYVTGRMHRVGIGTELLTRMENYMRGVGVRSISLVSRPMAEPFYKARGYVRDGVFKHYLQKTL